MSMLNTFVDLNLEKKKRTQDERSWEKSLEDPLRIH